tara:strand:- start:301 stop:561 length:261 start_codon:yes stop_codon:yes gene_type:complete
MKHSNVEIVKYKLTNKNKKGSYNKIDNIKLLAIDGTGREHYLKFVTEEFAAELLRISDKSEVINDLKSGYADYLINSYTQQGEKQW